MADTKYTPRMRQRYDEVVVKAMTEKFGYANRFAVPKVEKITLNMGVGEGSQDKKKVTQAASPLVSLDQRGKSGRSAAQKKGS